MPDYVVRYGAMRLLGVFSAAAGREYRRGISVVARTDRGLEIGEVLCEATAEATNGMNDPGTGQILREMTPEDRNRFIGQMVERLAARLKSDGRDLAGWLKLMRAYKVLGRDSDAAVALKDAKAQFEGDQKSLAEIEQAAKSLGLGL